VVWRDENRNRRVYCGTCRKGIESSRIVVLCTFVNHPERESSQEPRVGRERESQENEGRREVIESSRGRWGMGTFTS